MNVKTDLADVFRRSSAVSESRITQLGMEIQNQINNKKLIESKLEEATKEPGMKRYAAFLPSLIFIISMWPFLVMLVLAFMMEIFCIFRKKRNHLGIQRVSVLISQRHGHYAKSTK